MFSGLQWGKFLIKISIYDIFIASSLKLQFLCVVLLNFRNSVVR